MLWADSLATQQSVLKKKPLISLRFVAMRCFSALLTWCADRHDDLVNLPLLPVGAGLASLTSIIDAGAYWQSLDLEALVREAAEPERAPGDWPMVCTYQNAAKKWGVGAWLNESGKATFAALVLPTYPTEAAALVAALGTSEKW